MEPEVRREMTPRELKAIKKRKRKERRRQSKVFKFFRGLFIVLLALVLVGVLSVGGVAGYTLIYMNNKINGDIITDLNDYRQEQSQTTILYYKDENGDYAELRRLHGEINRVWVEYDDIPENLKNAFIALEDKRFWDHDGVDWISTIQIIVKGGFSRGGSTIDQQLIKNLTGENGRTFSRKFNEIISALNLEKNFSKEKILETYLNTLYLDAGCYGVETAAEYYFGKTCKELTLAECACLAAITKAPRTYDPIINPENNEKRRNDECLYFMRQQGLITEEEYRQAREEEIVFVGNSQAVRDAEDTIDSGDDIQNFYVDYVIDQLIEHFQTKCDMSYAQAFRKVYYGGLRVYTCMDATLQRVMEEVYENREGMGDNEDLQSAMAVVDYEGRLCGIIGYAGEKTANRCLNIAADSPRQPGSSIKPLSVYAPGIDGDYITWSSMVLNYGFQVDGKLWPYNYGGDPGTGSYMTVQAAIAPSYNTVPAQLARYLGIDYCYEYLTEHFHLNHLTDSDKAYAPIVCGGTTYGVTCLEMAAAYATFGNGGIYYEPCTYEYVTSADGGKVWLSRDTEGEQAIEPGTADVMQELLRTVVTQSNGTARKWYIDGVQTIAKTGTTTDNKDAWFIGGTPHYMVACWYGYSQNPQALTNIGGGNSPAGRMFKTVLDRVYEQNTSLDKNADFYKSGEATSAYYCTSSGDLSNGCSSALGWYKLSNMPSYCSGCAVHNGIGGSGYSAVVTATETETAAGGNESGEGVAIETAVTDVTSAGEQPSDTGNEGGGGEETPITPSDTGNEGGGGGDTPDEPNQGGEGGGSAEE